MRVYFDTAGNSDFQNSYKSVPLKRSLGYLNTSVAEYDRYTPSFGIRVDYGVPAELPKSLMEKVSHINACIDNIKGFFAQFATSNPALNARVKKGYLELVITNSSALVFNHDGNTIVTVMRGQRNRERIFLSHDTEGQDFNGIILDGDKLIANYRKNDPHMLPANLRYMNQEMLEAANPEYFIDLALEKISKYNAYIEKFQKGEKSLPLPDSKHPSYIKDVDKYIEEQQNGTGKIRKYRRVKRNKTAQPEEGSKTVRENKPADSSKNIPLDKKIFLYQDKIRGLLNTKSEDFPSHITPKTDLSGKNIGYSLKTADNGMLKVSENVLNLGKNKTVVYLTFEKFNPDDSRNYISIEISTGRILKTRDKGKPLTTPDNSVVYMPQEEVVKRKFEQKLDTYMSEIFPNINLTEELSKIPKPRVKKAPKTPKQPKQPKQTPEKPKTENIIVEDVQGIDINKSIENIKSKIVERAKKDAEAVAEKYRSNFVFVVKDEIRKFMKELNQKTEDFLASL